MQPSIRDVAKLAGVSVSTVSNVRTGNKYVRPELVKRVNDAIAELDYVPNPMASGLRGKKNHIIGVIIPSYTHIFHSQILKGIQEVCFGRNLIINTYTTDMDQKIEEQCLRICLTSQPDGIIISSYANDAEKHGAKCYSLLRSITKSKKNIPIISIERYLPIVGVESILSDYEEASFQAVRHLIKLGRKNIAHIAGRAMYDVTQKRLSGYKRALESAGIPFDPALIRYGPFLPENGYSNMKDLLTQEDIDAVFAGNDEIGIGAIKAIKDTGYHVPDDIAIIGTDNIYTGTLISPSLSTIDIPSYRLGKTAITRLLELIDSEEKPNYLAPTYLKTKIIVRNSTDTSMHPPWDISGW